MVFGWLKKKGAGTPVERATNYAVAVLTTQLETAGSRRDSLIDDTFVSGYLFGFVDSIAQHNKITGQPDRLALLDATYSVLFGSDAGRSLIVQSLARLNSDDEFMSAVMVGGQEVVEHLRNQTPPVKLVQYLLRSTKAGHST